MAGTKYDYAGRLSLAPIVHEKQVNYVSFFGNVQTAP